MNNINIIGRLTKDIEMRTTQSGLNIGNFSIAVGNPVKSGEESTTSFFNCKVFDKQAENMAKYFHKGSLVALSGRLYQDSYTAKDGTRKSTIEIIVNSFDFLEKKDAQAPAQAPTTPQATSPTTPSQEDDDLPF